MLHGAGARAALVRGIDRMSDLLRPTLQLVDPFEDTGAMIVRHLAWRTFDLLGDGAATAAVRAQSLIHEAMRYVTGGADPVQVCAGIERGLEAAREELRGQSRTIDLPPEIADLIAHRPQQRAGDQDWRDRGRGRAGWRHPDRGG
jgi:chaperonin GroEL (HSP60 family)